MRMTADRMDWRAISGARDVTKGFLATVGEESSSAGHVVELLKRRKESSSVGDEFWRAGGK